jgi:mono/diheme cytochrome c family protein
MRISPLVAILAISVAIVACDNMANQPKRLPFELPFGSQAHWPELPVPHTVARDDEPAPIPPATMAVLQRGQQRFDIYCSPCHARTGAGDGMIVQRGFPRPPSYFIARLREAPNQHFYDVITHGYGAMFSYADRVSQFDRWAIIAYIRALQASNDGQLADVPPDQRRILQ